MLRARVIPCLLLEGDGLVKTIKFKNQKYIGDPINAVQIFNEKEVDELIFLDIMASKEKEKPNFELINKIASEGFMPFCYGGGVKTVEDIRHILSLGAEKVSINSYALENPDFIKQASEIFGGQSIIVSVDVKKVLFGRYRIFDSNKNRVIDKDPLDFAVEMEQRGAGEIFLNSVDRDGTFEGYDTELIKRVSYAVNIPVIACGGAASIEHFVKAVESGASAVAAGSMFVFWGKHRAVLINYPPYEELFK